MLRSIGNQETLEGLKKIGVSRAQFEVYLLLYTHGPQTATDLSNALKRDRSVVYKYLDRLSRLGLIEKQLDRSNSYSARPASDVMSLISSMIDQEAKKNRSAIKEFFDKVETIERVEANPRVKQEYKLIFNRKRLYEELSRLFLSTRYEFRLIMSGNGLLRSIRHGQMDQYLEMQRRGVRIEIVSEVTPINIQEAEYLMRKIPFRHQNGLQIRLDVFDSDKVLLGAIQHDEDLNINREDDSYILIRDQVFAQGFIQLFDIIWNTSQDASKIINIMKSQQ
ncbi:MAG: MarR family transcriptional regulator [Nitrososphaerota archaeon]|nr:MarR family transcriptional regulator [Nitrososphaerota archaeon]MDG7045772.1 MarR family transcriptional regulator [Nitrososphaerota archaeon]